jgi:hypothetical protein
MGRDIGRRKADIVGGQPPGPDRGLTRLRILGLDEAAVGERPTIGTPTTLAAIPRPVAAAGLANPGNAGGKDGQQAPARERENRRWIRPYSTNVGDLRYRRLVEVFAHSERRRVQTRPHRLFGGILDGR